MSFTLRPMTPGDVDAVAAAEQELFAGDPPWTAGQFHDELAGVPDTRWYVVAETPGGELAGYAGLMASVDTADILTLAVLREHRRQGLGRLLLGALLGEARRRRVADVLLEVRADNVPALALYRTRDFEQLAVRRGYFGNGECDGLVLRLRVSH